jgi:sterol desaturase/sphingolipid hydroxylase (fatty acid hydroxylase superfamily)
MSLLSYFAQQLYIPALTLVLSGSLLWLWEIKQPFRKIESLSTFIQDLRELPIIFLFIVLSAQIYAYINDSWFMSAIGHFTHSAPWMFLISLPLWFRLLIAILIKDLIAYVNHWLMHNTWILWRDHKWHHLQKPMYWLKGNKNSLLAKIIAKWDFIAFPLLAIPFNITLFCVLAYSFFTFFVHTNIQWFPWMKVLERIFVTPRYHLVHHLNEMEYQHKNFGDIFTFFDRIFGTYIDPETVDISSKEFGLEDSETLTVRMILGI